MNREQYEKHIQLLIRDLEQALEGYANCVGDDLGKEISILTEENKNLQAKLCRQNKEVSE